MRQHERILVCIERGERDGRMLPYVRDIAHLAETKVIYLLHVSDEKTRHPVGAAGEALGESELTVDNLQALASEHLHEPGRYECLCEVVRGPQLIENLRFAHDKDIDLIVIGRHYGRVHEADDEARVARRLTRKATCSVLVLPEEHCPKADTILVPVRDSECSAKALDVACGIAEVTKAAVIALNVYQVHPGYLRVGTTLEEHEALLKTAARRECEALLNRLQTHLPGIRTVCTPDLHGKPVPAILEALEANSANLVVIGARGRTGAAGVLLGAVTEQLICESPMPVWAVKKKGECIGILRALLSLA